MSPTLPRDASEEQKDYLRQPYYTPTPLFCLVSTEAKFPLAPAYLVRYVGIPEDNHTKSDLTLS